MPASRTLSLHTGLTPYPPLSRRNLANNRLRSHEPLYALHCPSPDTDNSSIGLDSRIVVTDQGDPYSPSPSERSRTKEHQYPMGYEWQTQVGIRTRRRFRNYRPPPLRRSVIRYNELSNWNRTPSPPPLYNTDDPSPPFTNAWSGTNPNYPPFARIFKER